MRGGMAAAGRADIAVVAAGNGVRSGALADAPAPSPLDPLFLKWGRRWRARAARRREPGRLGIGNGGRRNAGPKRASSLHVGPLRPVAAIRRSGCPVSHVLCILWVPCVLRFPAALAALAAFRHGAAHRPARRLGIATEWPRVRQRGREGRSAVQGCCRCCTLAWGRRHRAVAPARRTAAPQGRRHTVAATGPSPRPRQAAGVLACRPYALRVHAGSPAGFQRSPGRTEMDRPHKPVPESSAAYAAACRTVKSYGSCAGTARASRSSAAVACWHLSDMLDMAAWLAGVRRGPQDPAASCSEPGWPSPPPCCACRPSDHQTEPVRRCMRRRAGGAAAARQARPVRPNCKLNSLGIQNFGFILDSFWEYLAIWRHSVLGSWQVAGGDHN